MGEKVITFETNNIIVKIPLDLGFNDIKFPYTYGEENIYFLLHQKHILIQEYETSTEKNEFECLFKKDKKLIGNENEDIFEYGNDFVNCKTIHNRD